MSETTGGLSIPVPTGRRLYWALFLNSQLLAAVIYVLLTPASFDSPRLVAYAAVWLNVSVWVVVTSQPSTATDRVRRRALMIGVAYFVLLAVIGGLVTVGVGEIATGLRVAPLPPGYGPALLYSGDWVTVTLMPNYLVGYAALAYLVYLTVIDAAGSAAAGVIGLFSCVSCSWPLLASLVSAITGGGSLLATSILEASYGVSTVVFLLTAGLLYWQPAMLPWLKRLRST